MPWYTKDGEITTEYREEDKGDDRQVVQYPRGWRLRHDAFVERDLARLNSRGWPTAGSSTTTAISRRTTATIRYNQSKRCCTTAEAAGRRDRHSALRRGGAKRRLFPRELVVHTPSGRTLRSHTLSRRSHCKTRFLSAVRITCVTEPADLYRFHWTGPRVCGQRLYRTVSAANTRWETEHHILNCDIR